MNSQHHQINEGSKVRGIYNVEWVEGVVHAKDNFIQFKAEILLYAVWTDVTNTSNL